MAETLGECRLCREIRPLRNSHLMAKALYRYLAFPSGNEYLAVTKGKYTRTSKQIAARLLCSECEERFNSGGERWMLRNGYRGQRFRLRDSLKATRPIFEREQVTAFSARAASEISVPQLIYYAVSVFWRAAVHTWGDCEDPLDFGKRYELEFRNYFLGQSEFPLNSTLVVYISDSDAPLPIFSTPYGAKDIGFFHYRFFAQGVLFTLCIGSKIRPKFRHLCLVRSPENFIVVSSKVDDVARSGLSERLKIS